MSCCFCGFDSKSKAVFVSMENGKTRCKSGAACMRRLRSGEHLKARVKLALENPPVHSADEPARVAREVRAVYYRFGLCVTCGTRRHSAGRPRCDECHRNYLADLT